MASRFTFRAVAALSSAAAATATAASPAGSIAATVPTNRRNNGLAELLSQTQHKHTIPKSDRRKERIRKRLAAASKTRGLRNIAPLGETEKSRRRNNNNGDDSDLGILGGTTKTKRTEARKLLECPDERPLVRENAIFQRVIKICLDFPDDCPYKSTGANVGCWNTSQVTSMKYAFYKIDDFNGPLDQWDTSSVTDMSDMFGFSPAFNQPLDSWDTSSVKDTSDMFWGARAFNQPIGNWNTQSLETMDYMFLDAQSFDQPIEEWDVSGVTDAKAMFAYAYSFNQPLAGWETTFLRNTTKMFLAAKSFDQPLVSWDVSSVQIMEQMFFKAESFNQNLDAWNTRSVTDMQYMFNKAYSFDQCLETWAEKNPTTVTQARMFNGTKCSQAGAVPNAFVGPWCQTKEECAANPPPTEPSASSIVRVGVATVLGLAGLVVPSLLLAG